MVCIRTPRLDSRRAGFHYDRSLLTVNVALADDALHAGGRLVAITTAQPGAVDDNSVGAGDDSAGAQDALRVVRMERSEGSETAHTGKLPHAVTRMTAGRRYSLILFLGMPCTRADSEHGDTREQHQLLFANVSALRRLQTAGEGARCCTSCGRSAEPGSLTRGATRLSDDTQQRRAGMWRCAVGCDFQLCCACHEVKACVRGWRARHGWL